MSGIFFVQSILLKFFAITIKSYKETSFNLLTA